MISTVSGGIAFIVALIVSMVIIFVITKFFSEREGIVTALIAAIAGTVIYTIVYYFMGGLDSCIHRRGSLAGGPAVPVQHRLGQGPGHCRDRVARDIPRRVVPAHPRRSHLKGESPFIRREG